MWTPSKKPSANTQGRVICILSNRKKALHGLHAPVPDLAEGEKFAAFGIQAIAAGGEAERERAPLRQHFSCAGVSVSAGWAANSVSTGSSRDSGAGWARMSASGTACAAV